MPQQDNYTLLIQKLDQFTRKYYINQVIRGVLYSTGLILLLFWVWPCSKTISISAPRGAS